MPTGSILLIICIIVVMNFCYFYTSIQGTAIRQCSLKNRNYSYLPTHFSNGNSFTKKTRAARYNKIGVRYICQRGSFCKTVAIRKMDRYPQNTMVLLYNANREKKLVHNFTCVSQNLNHTKKELLHVREAYNPVPACKYTTYIATCKILNNFNNFVLTQKNGRSVKIPYRKPYNEKRLEVALCLSPLFYNEQWQLILTVLEIYYKFGIQLQVFYIQSILSDIMSVLKIYESQKIVSIEPWSLLSTNENRHFEYNLNPNAEMEWRNQAAANTDCILKYKDAARFIIINDLDDVLIPALGKTYLEEFQILSLKYPKAAAFLYSRFTVNYTLVKNFEEFSIKQQLKQTYIDIKRGDGKSVIDTSKVESVWLHWPGIMKPGTELVTVPDTLNRMFHLKYFQFYEEKRNKTNTMPPYKNNSSFIELIKKEALESIILHFRQQTYLNSSFKVFNKLKSRNIYLPESIKCYKRLVSGMQKSAEYCPTPYKCHFAKHKDTECSVAAIPYTDNLLAENITIYIPEKAGYFLTERNGCSL